MSTDRDEYHSDCLDVAEQHSSSPIPAGDYGPRESASYSSESNTTKTVSNRSPSYRDRGEVGKSIGKASSRSKTRKGPNDTISQVIYRRRMVYFEYI